jgi:predicted DNA-binding transcriptional regulator AlpA
MARWAAQTPPGVLSKMPRYDALPASLPPRGLSREAAAQYVGIGVSMFDRLVKGGRLPRPISIGGRRVWDRAALDRSFNALSGARFDEDEPDHWAEYLNGQT